MSLGLSLWLSTGVAFLAGAGLFGGLAPAPPAAAPAFEPLQARTSELRAELARELFCEPCPICAEVSALGPGFWGILGLLIGFLLGAATLGLCWAGCSLCAAVRRRLDGRYDGPCAVGPASIKWR